MNDAPGQHAATLHSVEHLQGASIRHGGLVFSAAVSAANIFRDIREHITNTLGGRMERYEALVAETTQRALDDLAAKARAEGYDGVVGVRIVHPNVVDGGVEVVAYGTGYHLDSAPREA